MRSLMLKLWNDDGGAIIAIEFVLFVVIILIGLIVGYVAVRNGIVAELTSLAEAVDGIAICFSYAGLSNCESSVCGSSTTFSATNTNLGTAKTPATFNTSLTNNPCQ